MKLNIRGKNLSVTPAIKEYIEKKLSKLDKYFKDGDNTASNVIIKTRGNKDVIEVTIIKNATVIRAEVMDNDLYTAIDLVVEKLERQIRKNKEKYNTIRAKKNKDLESIFEDFVGDKEDKEPTVVKRKTIDTSKPMEINEAILQLEFVSHDFFIFKDSKTEQICVLYKRCDGDYGVIEVK